ncbi:MAG TPA: hypothetical protein VF663_10540 [Telluria sp.]
MTRYAILKCVLVAGMGLAGAARAALPPPSPAQAQAAAVKKADADAKAAQEKERLAATMDRVSTRWSQRAASEGYKIVPPVGAAAPVPLVAASDVTPPDAGVPAAAPANAAPGTAAASPATGAAPRSVHALRSAAVPVKSEKLGTARPSEDVKRGPTPTLPAGAAPTVNKKGVPDDAHKQ